MAPSSPKEVVRAFINAFIEAWPTGDAARLAGFFAEDAVYHNVPLQPVQGREAIRQTLEELMSAGGRVAIDVVNLLSEGRVVMVERVDYLAAPDRTISVPMAGVFEVRDGQITAWRDYFDLSQAR